MYTERAKAKINLTLDVLYKRPDGYHEVEMIMQTIDLSDHLLFQEIQSDRVEVSCTVPYIPTDERNLVYKAAKLLKTTYGINKGIAIHIDKRIPVSAGLAGGSSDGAATIRGLNRIWNLNLSVNEMQEFGAKLGSDIPFCISGGTALARGRGEQLIPLTPAPPMWVVLVKPSLAVSTADVYGNLQVSSITQHPSASRMQRMIELGTSHGLIEELGNVLENVTCNLYPEVLRMKQKMSELSGTVSLMSGSGPTLFCLFDREAKAIRLYNALRGFVKEVYLSKFF